MVSRLTMTDLKSSSLEGIGRTPTCLLSFTVLSERVFSVPYTNKPDPDDDFYFLQCPGLPIVNEYFK